MNASKFLLTLLLPIAAATAAQGDGGHEAHHAPAAAAAEEQAFGRPGDAAQVSRTVDVTMSDAFRYSPAAIAVRQGETIRFRVHNAGKLVHEMILGTPADLRAHADLMKKFPGMEHDEPSMVKVAPGTTGDIVWRFTRPGEFQFACLQPGHYEGGMVGRVAVAAETAAAAVPWTEGVIRKVDREQKKVTIRHGPIVNLEMPGMTMVFPVTDPSTIESLKAGDKVRFVAERISGVVSVTKIEAIK